MTRQSLLLALGIFLGLPAPGQAADPYDLDAQNFRPAMDARSFITVERSKLLGTMEPSLGLYLNYGFSPLKQTIDGEEEALIESYGAANLVLALGFFHWVEVGADIPMVIIRGDSDGPGDEPGGGGGDGRRDPVGGGSTGAYTGFT